MGLKKWRKLTESIVSKNPWWTYKKDTFELPTGKPGEYHYVHTNGSSMVVPILGGLLTALAATLPAGAESAPGQPAGSPKGKMPGKLLLGSLVQQYRPVAFDHAKHVGMAGSCADCHHQHDGGRDLSCSGCHRIDAASFKKNVNLARIRPCGECHPASYHPQDPGRPTLSAAYHRACIKCHREVGSVGRDPKGGVELCHETNAQAMAR